MRKNAPTPIQTPDGILHPDVDEEICEVIPLEKESDRVQPTEMISWRFNYRILIILAIATVMTPLLVAAAHKYQMQRMATIFLQRAEIAEAEGDLHGAVKNIGRYLQFKPSDLDAGIRMALHLHTIAEGPQENRRVYFLFGRILRQDPSQNEVRLKRAKLLLQQQGIRYLREAVADLDILIGQLTEQLANMAREGMANSVMAEDNRTKQLQYELLRARGLERLAKTDEAILAYQKIINLDPYQINGYKRLAELLSKRPKSKLKAKDVLDDLVRLNPKHPSAYAARSYFRQHNGNMPAAIEDGRKAIQLAPRDPEILILAATIIVAESRVDNGRDSFDVRKIHANLEKALNTTREQISDNEEQQSPNTDKADSIAVTRLRDLLVESLANLDLVLQQPEAAIRQVQEGVKEAPDNAWLKWVLANFLLKQERIEECNRQLQEIRELDKNSPFADFLEARVCQARGQWRQAIEKCRLLSSDVTLKTTVPGEVNLLRAQCEEKLGHTQRQLQAYRDALKENPSSIAALRGLAITYSSLGMIPEARKTLRFLTNIPGIQLIKARLEITQNLQLPAAGRKWGDVEQLIDAAAKQGEDIVNILITRAQVRVHQGDRKAAADLLRRASRQQPERMEIWVARVELNLSGGDVVGATKILDQAEKKLGKKSEFLLARLRIAPLLEKEQAKKQLKQLSASLENIDEKQQVELLRGFAKAHERIGQHDAAANYWEQVAKLKPLDLTVLRQRFHLAIISGSLDAIAGPKGLLAAMEKIEGKSGPYFRLATANYLIALATQGDRRQLDKARQVLQSLSDSKAIPDKVLVAQGHLEQLDDHLDRAVDYYENAVDHGSTDARVVRFLIQHYNSHGKFRKSNHIIELFQKNSRRPLSGEFGRIAALTSAMNQNYEQAIDYARSAMDSNSQDFREHILLGQLHLSAEQSDLAEVYFRTALKYGKDQPDAWVAWITFLKKFQREDDIAAALKNAQQQFSAKNNPLALARCHEATGDTLTAEKHFQEALQQNQKDLALLQTVAEFFIRNNKSRKADSLLREILADDSSATPVQRTLARRALAGVLGSSGGYPNYLAAMELIQKNLDANPTSTSDLRAKATLLASRPSRLDRREALKIFRKIEDLSLLQPTDHFTIAKLHLSLGKWSHAKSSLRLLRQMRAESPAVLAFGIRAMIDNGDLETAGEWLKSLNLLEPDHLRTVELQARHHIAENRVEIGLALLQKATKPRKDNPPLATKVQVASLLVGITESLDAAGRAVASQKVSNQAKIYLEETLPENPEHILLMVRLLSLEFAFDQAIARLEEAWPTINPEYVAATTLGVLKRDPKRAEWIPQIHKHLDEAVKKNPNSSNLLFLAASLAHLEEDYDTATKYYRRSLKIRPNSVLAQNELALILALRGQDVEEALQLINNAIQQAGPLPNLLDTRATVYLAMNQAQPAVQDLKLAIAESPSSTKHFHMAQAWSLLGNRPAAKTSMRNAIATNTNPELIHPLEREAFALLKKQFQ